MASTNRRAGCRSIGDGSVRTGGVELVWGYYQAQADTTRELDIKGRIDEV